MKLLVGVVLSLLFASGCGGASRRSITTPVVDEHTGTVYAFETDDRRGSSDETIVILCNEALTRVCYRVRPVDALSPEDVSALQAALRELRRRAAE